MDKTQKRRRLLQLCILLLFLPSLLFLYFLPTKQELSAEMYFRDAEEGILSQLFWGEDGELSAQNCVDGIRTGNAVTFLLPVDPSGFQTIRLDPSNTDAPYRIFHIAFLLNGERFLQFTPEEIAAVFLPVNATLALDGEDVAVMPQNTDSGLYMDDPALTSAAVKAAGVLRVRQIRERFFGAFCLTAALLLAVSFSGQLARYVRSLFSRDANGRFDWLALLSVAVMAGALLVVTVIGLFSDLGLHPDEWDVKACLDYGMTHFLPPDMRDPAVSGTYSGYGYTKLENYTWYFFLAGKIAWFFQKMLYFLPYYRIPNILLFVACALLVVRNVQKQKWLAVAFCICVQAWYIFSYTTADALDFFWSFLAVYQLSDPESLLYHTVGLSKVTRRSVPAFCLLGILYGMILLGKPNYYSLLALTFCVLLFRLIGTKNKKRRKALFRNYCIILGIFAATVAFRASFDVMHYGFDKASVKEMMEIQYCSPDKNPLTPVEEQGVSWHMMSKGYSLGDFFAENPEWFAMSYKSFCGITQLTHSDTWYYVLMGFLYAAIFASIGVETFRHKIPWGRAVFGVGVLLMVGGVVASVLNSYIIDSQAQGRYLLPLILIAGYLASRTPALFEKRLFCALVMAAAFLSVAFFGLRGVPMFL